MLRFTQIDNITICTWNELSSLMKSQQGFRVDMEPHATNQRNRQLNAPPV